MDKQLTIRQRAGRFLLGREMDRLEESVEMLAHAYRRGPYVQTPEMLIKALSEMDSQLLDMIMRRQGYETIMGGGIFDLKFTEQQRLRVVDQTRHAFHYDSQAGRAVNAWTDFGFGQRPIVKPDDTKLAVDFDEFWTAKRNAPVLNPSKLHNLSNAVVTDGEVFFVYWFGADGKAAIRRLDTKAIVRIEYEKGDPDVPLYYVENRNITHGDSQRQYSEVWYPDWRATKEQLDKVEFTTNALHAQELREYTRVVVQRVSYQDIGGRGWPTIYRALAWYQAYKESLEDRAAVMAHVAMFPSKVKHKAGSRYTDSLKDQLQSTLATGDYGQDRNPPAVAGSNWIENEAANRSRMNMNTGALDSQKDTYLLLAQMSTGDGLPPVFRGRSDMAQNRSVAEMAAVPWQEQMDRYSGVWENTFREMVEIVGSGMVYAKQASYSDFSATVSVSRPALMEVSQVAQAMDSINSAAMNGTLDLDKAKQANEALTKLILEKYGLSLQEPAETKRDVMPPAVDEMIVKLAAQKITAQEFAGVVWDVLRG